MDKKDSNTPRSKDKKKDIRKTQPDPASELTSLILQAMGWKEFDDLLNSLEGVNKGRQIHVMNTFFCS